MKAALRAGARPEMVYGRDSLTRRARKPDTIAHGPNRDVLILARFGRMTRLGRMWDEQRSERSRSPCVIPLAEPVPADSKGG